MTPIQKTAIAISHIDEMMDAIVKVNTTVNTELDDQCRKAYAALGQAKEELTMVLMVNYTTKGAA